MVDGVVDLRDQTKHDWVFKRCVRCLGYRPSYDCPLGSDEYPNSLGFDPYRCMDTQEEIQRCSGEDGPRVGWHYLDGSRAQPAEERTLLQQDVRLAPDRPRSHQGSRLLPIHPIGTRSVKW